MTGASIFLLFAPGYAAAAVGGPRRVVFEAAGEAPRGFAGPRS